MPSNIPFEWHDWTLPAVVCVLEANVEKYGATSESAIALAAIESLQVCDTRRLERAIEAAGDYLPPSKLAYYRGLVAYEMGHTQEGIQLLEMSVAGDPVRDATLSLAWRYHEVGRNDDSKRLLEALLEVDDRDVTALMGMGALCAKEGSWEQAEQCYRAAGRAAPSRDGVWRALGEVCWAQRKWQDAIHAFRKTIKYRHSELADTCSRLILAYVNNGNLCKARACAFMMRCKYGGCDSVREIGAILKGVGGYGVELFDQGWHQEAVGVLRLEAKAESGAGIASFYLAAARSLLSHDVRYIENIIEHIDSSVDRDLVHQVYGAILYDLGHCDAGIAEMEKAIELNPCRINLLVLASRLEANNVDATKAAILYDKVKMLECDEL